MTVKMWYTANCDVCNPHRVNADPVLYDEIEKRNFECQQHADKTGHVIRVGFVFL